MYKFLSYLEENIINIEYCQKFDIPENSFYLRTEYKGIIEIKPLIDIDFYECLLEHDLVKDFNERLLIYVRFHQVKILNLKGSLEVPNVLITEGSILRYTYFDIPRIRITKDMLEFQYLSKLDPLDESINRGNYELFRREIATLPKFENKEFIASINSRRCKIITNNYKKLIFTTADGYFIKCAPDAKELSHEGFINYVLNQITDIPNIPKFVGYLRDDKVVPISPIQSHWNSPVDYLITEKVQAISLESYLNIASSVNAILSIIQVIYTLHDLYHLGALSRENDFISGFTHNDLHIKNIIVKVLSEPLSIKYSRRTLEVSAISILVDFEFSHIRCGDAMLGFNDPTVCVYNQPFWIHDIFQFLMSTYDLCESIVESNKELSLSLRMLTQALKFFTGTIVTKKEFDEYHSVNRYLNLRYPGPILQYKDFIEYYDRVINEILNDKMIK